MDRRQQKNRGADADPFCEGAERASPIIASGLGLRGGDMTAGPERVDRQCLERVDRAAGPTGNDADLDGVRGTCDGGQGGS